MSHLKLCYSMEDATAQRQQVWEKARKEVDAGGFVELPATRAVQLDMMKWNEEHCSVAMHATYTIPGFPPIFFRLTVGVIVVKPEMVDEEKETVLTAEATRTDETQDVDQAKIYGTKEAGLFQARVDIPLEVEYTVMIRRDRIHPPKRDQHPVLSLVSSGVVGCTSEEGMLDCIRHWVVPSDSWGVILDSNDGKKQSKILTKPAKPTTAAQLIIP